MAVSRFSNFKNWTFYVFVILRIKHFTTLSFEDSVVILSIRHSTTKPTPHTHTDTKSRLIQLISKSVSKTDMAKLQTNR